MTDRSNMVDPAVFQSLQGKIDEDSEIREQLRNAVQTLEKQVDKILTDAFASIKEQSTTVVQLAQVANKYPYYRYNGIWTRDVQNTIFVILLYGWLDDALEGDRLITIERVGEVLQVPVNLKDRDAFHITIEEYLQALISLVDELARLAVNSVTMGDYERPLEISQFIKDVHAGFQMLNLKNDSLRRRSDSIKYSVKKVEDVVYDLSLRNLVPKKA